MEYDLCLCEGQKERSLSSEHNERRRWRGRCRRASDHASDTVGIGYYVFLTPEFVHWITMYSELCRKIQRALIKAVKVILFLKKFRKCLSGFHEIIHQNSHDYRPNTHSNLKGNGAIVFKALRKSKWTQLTSVRCKRHAS